MTATASVITSAIFCPVLICQSLLALRCTARRSFLITRFAMQNY
jgi:hypothetical protein